LRLFADWQNDMVWQTMNERIRLLLSQAGIHYEVLPKDTVYEKFAELIVQECVQICHKLAEDSDSYVVHDGDTCAEQIKQYFGVES